MFKFYILLIKTTGIVFRAVKYSETSIITDIYTEELGLRAYIISGVRSKNAKVSAGLLQVMSLVEAVVYHREDKDLCRIKEIKAAYLFEDIPFNVQKGAIGLFLLEIMQKTIKEREQNEPLFKFLFNTICYLDETSDPIYNFHLSTMVKLSAYLGFLPSGEYSKTTPFFDLQEGTFVAEPSTTPNYLEPELSQLLDQFLKTGMNQSHTISLTRPQRTQFLNELINYYRLHVENLPTINAHKVLKTVLEE